MYSLNSTALEIKELKEELALYSAECKLIRKGNTVTVYTSDITLARKIASRGYDVYVA